MSLSMMRIVSWKIGMLVVSVCCLEAGVHAMTRSAGSIVPAGQMTVARFDHAAVLLPSGRVLIVGGIERNGVMQPGAELFDPVTGRFTATGRPQTQHGWGVTATLLRTGKVLIAGGSTGCDAPCFTASAELYDPVTGIFALTGKMTVPRAEARAVLLGTGDVLFVGGTAITESSPFETGELYHPSSGNFTSIGATHLSDATQIMLLSDGKTLVAGSAGTDVYDPSTRRFTSAGAMTVPRSKFGGALFARWACAYRRRTGWRSIGHPGHKHADLRSCNREIRPWPGAERKAI
jgi:hypothetical protein